MSSFRMPGRIEIEYQRALRRMMREVVPIRGENQSLEAWLDEFSQLSNKVEILQIAIEIARNMVINVNVSNARDWREASRRSQRSLMLFNQLERELQGPIGARLQQLVQQNAQLISSIPQEVAGRLTSQIYKAQQAGVRSETIANHIALRFPQLTTNRIHLLARTGTTAAATALTQSRAEGLDLPWYEWLTSKDQRVRRSHRNMSGVLVTWHDAPSPEQLVDEKSTLGHYHAGNCPNCRCITSPILTIDDVRWPHKVYFSGSIHMMTRAQFRRMTGIPERVAA